MIQANELRTGNLVYPINRNGKIHLPEEIPFVITEVALNEVKAYLQGKPLHQVIKYDNFSIRDISPIPLTEEWLVRLGFECEDWNALIDIHKGKKLNLCLRSFRIYIGYYYDWNLLCNINYVNQLQNLYFSLAGQELELI